MAEPGRRAVLTAMGAAALTAGGAARAQPAAPSRPLSPVVERIEIVSSGHIWTEGPLWVGDASGYLLFSDVPGNTIFRWDGKQVSEFLKPSGWAGAPMPDVIREGGTNGLTLGRGGLLVADSGNRCVSVVDLETKRRTVLVDRWEGKRFNSPNDLVVASNGDIYFTDPPYGLLGVERSPVRELPFMGVFRITPDDRLHLISDNLLPNGIAITRDRRRVLATDRTGWVAIDLDAQARPVRQSLFLSAETLGGRGDGMKLDPHGNLWCSGPGGVHVISATGERLGHILVNGPVSNCALGADGYVYISNRDRMVRGKIRADFLEAIQGRGAG